MSEDTPLDPLAALRAADSRPLVEQIRDQATAHLVRLKPAVGRVAGVAFIVALVGFAAWRIFASSDPPLEDLLPLAVPEAEAAAVSTTGTGEAPAVLVVHVAGAVNRPGLVVGDIDWRVADAIAAAGGSSTVADLDRVNLASHLADGERIYVPHLEEAALPVVVTGGQASSKAQSGPIDLNAATEDDLDALPGVGPATAASIVAHRTDHGPFGSIDALVAVSGIGPAKLESIRDHVVVR
ncbi:MAG: ComEA family DNA-binding protein [Acidimicrobiales bacterium]|nr:ComEA family DNA-binding protein [Acidimicrobiales bacterium]RZV43802.1 MAG: ComEA family DNA-binding protein [Acidimicrobiales bacterium]